MANFEKAPAEVQEILSKPIRQLGLKVEGSPLERFVQQLYKELDAKGLHRFHPKCYLTDEWGCPNMEPVIGIPFYLADPKLQRLEAEMNDIEDARQIMMYLRHEAGHAFNYAYALYKTQEWRSLFGPFRRPYRDNYKPVAFSRQFVRHMEGWYAQKHPDEDFAETFAVWLTPRSNWRKRYQGWGAMKKLLYVDRIGRKFGDADPVVARGDTDITVEEMEVTVGEFYQRALEQQLAPGELLQRFHAPQEECSPGGRASSREPQGSHRQGQLLDRRAASAGQSVGGNHRSKSQRPGPARRHKM